MCLSLLDMNACSSQILFYCVHMPHHIIIVLYFRSITMKCTPRAITDYKESNHTCILVGTVARASTCHCQHPSIYEKAAGMAVCVPVSHVYIRHELHPSRRVACTILHVHNMTATTSMDVGAAPHHLHTRHHHNGCSGIFTCCRYITTNGTSFTQYCVHVDATLHE